MVKRIFKCRKWKILFKKTAFRNLVHAEICVCVTFKYYIVEDNLYFEVANSYQEYLPTQLSGLLFQIAKCIIFSGSFQINFKLEKKIEADIVFCIVSYSDGVLRHLTLYGVLELPGRKNAKMACFKL